MLSTDDVRISPERQKEWNKQISTEKPGAPNRGDSATASDRALDYVSDQRRIRMQRKKVIKNLQKKHGS